MTFCPNVSPWYNNVTVGWALSISYLSTDIVVVVGLTSNSFYDWRDEHPEIWKEKSLLQSCE